MEQRPFVRAPFAHRNRGTMHKNLIWQAFLLVILAASLWYSAIALYRYYNYSHLEAKTPVSSIDWEIEEQSEEKFLVKGN